MHVNELNVSHFRCFRDEQRVRLAPITLLVGENSTGKTSFLALTRVLWDIAFRHQFPDFTQPPYDLGSFDEIAHHRRGERATEFSAGLAVDPRSTKRHRAARRRTASRFEIIFGREGAAPVPKVRRLVSEDSWVEASVSPNGKDVSVRFATRNGQWAARGPKVHGRWNGPSEQWDVRQRQLPPMAFLIRTLLAQLDFDEEPEGFEPENGTKVHPTEEDMREVWQLDLPQASRVSDVFSSAPVRSRPRRTYDPTHTLQDPEGVHIPMYLWSIARGDQKTWESAKSSLEDFGQASGLFDEIAVKTLGGKAGGPFQIQIRKFGKRAKGPRRNIIDVGYGVSQVLPIVTELLRPRGPRMFLLQQPEVHLHPSAQAALGSLFCDVAANERQLLVETHSDHLIDRVRMDVRDKTNKLRPEDVSILYFERRNLSVTIHSLGWDANGRLVGRSGPIPDGYRTFFRTERRRSLGL